MKKTFLTAIILLFHLSIFSQVNVDAIGVYGGLGNIKGNSAAVSSFTTSIFFDTKLFFTNDVSFRFSFVYARKLEALLPSDSDSRYFPFQRGVSIKVILEQPISEYFYLEEGLGPLVLNDRTFSDTNEWGIGAAFHIAAGIDFRNYKQSGFKLAIGSDIGNTFTQTTPSYFSAHIQIMYYF